MLQVLSEVLAGRLPSKSREECAELAERLAPRVVLSLQRIAEEFREDGVEPPYSLYADDKTSYVKSIETKATAFLESLLALEPKEFEAFCARLLQKMGGTAFVVGQSGDGGVDFTARDVKFYGHSGPAPAGARVLVVGQAKKYAKENLISENDLRAFVGGAIRRISSPGDSCFRAGIVAPVVFAFWTTSDFHPSAKGYAKAVGLWYLSGLAVSQLAIRIGIDTP